ncbi:endonuclease/exonuclease/phosphatase family protein [Antarcticibacterium sp. 1MA-6-2]|uniref:endonuclease/exonuclease/phosphatase family protein n=1 Tax=Antarcticibacterium sp. 1MA-6-2 TaxID=2908210 RepID=UPI001F2FAEE8|nr:endonuclease/exonuclease/phosphatase family protein [Antarcticibacterium sp. 1MA-6-2]UJH92447.1 endonuclease/exonuclease/phosphatase family protein [Antarcticibacterium sp. 1MA-6-2]
MTKKFFIPLLLMILTFSASAQVEVMSYNIRYANESDGENGWSKRRNHITNQLKFYEPHVLGLQEALLVQIAHFKENLPGYEYVGVGREDGKQKGEYTAIFYDTEKLEALENHTFWLSETPSKVSTGWDAALPRVCTYLKLKDKQTNQEFWVFNSHFDHKGEKARFESAKIILKKIDEVNTQDLPVILMGDFNIEPDAEGIVVLAEEMNDSKMVCQKVSFGPEGTFNGYNFNEPVTKRIDYIFTSKENIEVLKYAVLSNSKDLKYPSDHLRWLRGNRFSEIRENYNGKR